MITSKVFRLYEKVRFLGKVNRITSFFMVRFPQSEVFVMIKKRHWSCVIYVSRDISFQVGTETKMVWR